MCSDYEKSLVQPIYENDGLGPRALPETHPLLQDWQVTSCSPLGSFFHSLASQLGHTEAD